MALYLLRRPVLLVLLSLTIGLMAAVAVPQTRDRLSRAWSDYVWWRIYAVIHLPRAYIGF